MASPDEGSSVSARSEIDRAEREQAYGPIRLRRYFKGDGRALILYTHGEPAHGEPADGEPADGEPTGGGPGREEPAHE